MARTDADVQSARLALTRRVRQLIVPRGQVATPNPSDAAAESFARRVGDPPVKVIPCGMFDSMKKVLNREFSKQ